MHQITDLIAYYATKYEFNEFYPRLLNNIKAYQQDHIDNPKFLEGCKVKPEADISKDIDTMSGDVRIDLPVWFGNMLAHKRFIWIGLEPRDTRYDFNVEKIGNFVYATPFGIEKSYSRYYKLFAPFINLPDTFHLFIDVVKEYEVVRKTNNIKEDKIVNDKNARRKFPQLSKTFKGFIAMELETIEPTTILCLGSQTYNFMHQNFSSDLKYEIKLITHPAAWGGMKKAEKQLHEVFSV